MSLFEEEEAERKIEDQRGRLISLIKFERGEGKEAVKHCIRQPKEFCENVKALTRKKYCNFNNIFTAYRKQTKKLPQLKPGDVTVY